MTRVGSLRDVVEKSTGTRNPAVQPDDEFTYVDVSAIDNQQKIINGAKLLLGSEAPSRARKLLRANDVLVSTVRPNLNAVALVTSELDGQVGSTGFCVLRAVPSRALPEYLFYFVRSQRFVDALAGLVAGALYPAVTDSQVLDQELPLPSLSEQRRIVDLLSRAEGIVRLRRQAQQKAAALIPAIFVDMFGRLPEDSFQRAEDVCHFITKGTTPKSQDLASKLSGDAVPFIKVLHIADDGGLEFDRQPSFISRSLHQAQFARSVVYPNDVLMNIVGPPLGRITKVPSTFGEWNINQALAIFRPRESVLPTFLFHALRSSMVLPEVLKLPVGVRQLNISLAQCRNIRIPVPSLAQQQTFVEAAAAMESIVSLQRAATQRAEAAFQALLAKSFGTGEAHREVHNLERALA